MLRQRQLFGGTEYAESKELDKTKGFSESSVHSMISTSIPRQSDEMLELRNVSFEQLDSIGIRKVVASVGESLSTGFSIGYRVDQSRQIHIYDITDPNNKGVLSLAFEESDQGKYSLIGHPEKVIDLSENPDPRVLGFVVLGMWIGAMYAPQQVHLELRIT